MFMIVHMRSPSDDRTARAIIRDEALRLFAARGPDAVTVREVAAAARVSPSLVIRHYRSKDGLRQAVDDYTVLALEAALAEITRGPAGTGPFDPRALPTLTDAVSRHLPPGSPVSRYLGRMLTSGGPTATAVFRRLHAVSQQTLSELARRGLADAGGDPAVRAAFLLINDLALLMLRDRLADVLGADPLSPEGMARWASEVLAIYRDGLTAAPSAQP